MMRIRSHFGSRPNNHFDRICPLRLHSVPPSSGAGRQLWSWKVTKRRDYGNWGDDEDEDPVPQVETKHVDTPATEVTAKQSCEDFAVYANPWPVLSQQRPQSGTKVGR